MTGTTTAELLHPTPDDHHEIRLRADGPGRAPHAVVGRGFGLRRGEY